jgi:electron transfer flavoprotein beta subunit
MSIHIIVCIKSVVRSAPGGVTVRQPENSELNPFDRPAIEAALSLTEPVEGRVTALSMGPPVAGTALAEAQAMGVDRCILVSDPALAGSDTLVTARVLAAAIDSLKPFDFLFFGARTSDSDTGQVGPQTAAVLNLPFVSGVTDARAQNSHWQVERTMDDWAEQWEVQPPAAFSIHPKAFPPRPTSLIGVAEAYDRPRLESLGLEALNLLPEKVGLVGSPTRVASMEKIKRSRHCEIIEGEPTDQVSALMKRLGERGVLT